MPNTLGLRMTEAVRGYVRVRLLLVVLTLLPAILFIGCADEQLKIPDYSGMVANASLVPPVDLPPGIVGTWWNVLGDTRTVLTFNEGETGEVWCHVADPNAVGCSATFPFSYSLDESTMTIVFDDASQEQFVIARISAEAFEAEAPPAPADPESDGEQWVNSGIWVRD